MPCGVAKKKKNPKNSITINLDTNISYLKGKVGRGKLICNSDEKTQKFLIINLEIYGTFLQMYFLAKMIENLYLSLLFPETPVR